MTSHRAGSRRRAALRYPIIAGVIGGAAALVVGVLVSSSSDGSPARSTQPVAGSRPVSAPVSAAGGTAAGGTAAGVAAAGTATASAGALPRATVVGADPVSGAGAQALSVPVRVRIPAIDVDSGLQRLGREPDGSLEPPTKWAVAGWYAGGVVPGQVGPAVIAGHVDSTAGPAVFFRLSQMVVGDRVTVDAADGTRTTFVVDRIQRFVKAKFPTEQVYGPVPVPELRLVTCTGVFDRKAHSYLDNLVVSAHLV